MTQSNKATQCLLAKKTTVTCRKSSFSNKIYLNSCSARTGLKRATLYLQRYKTLKARFGSKMTVLRRRWLWRQAVVSCSSKWWSLKTSRLGSVRMHWSASATSRPILTSPAQRFTVWRCKPVRRRLTSFTAGSSRTKRRSMSITSC
jgi:hypothetical protein